MGRLSTMIAAGLAMTGLALAAGSASADGGADALSKCAKIKDAEARLICFDAVTAAMKNRRAAPPAPAPAPKAAPRPKADSGETARLRREAELARREAELAKQEAALERRRLEAERAEIANQKRLKREEQSLEQKRAEEARREAERAKREAERERDRLAAERARLAERPRADKESRARQPDAPAATDKEPELTPEEAFGANHLVKHGRKAKGAPDEVDSITVKVVKVGRNPLGKVWVVLENGQKWRQKDVGSVRYDKKGENTVTIRKAFLGSFLMRFNDRGRAIRVERLR